MPLNFFALDLSKECFWSVSFIIFLIGSSDLVDYFNSMKKNVKKPRRFALLMVLVAGILIPHLEGCSSDKAEKQGETKTSGGELPVTAVVAKTSMTANGIAVVGSLLANEEVELVAEIAGKVKGIYFKEGARVKKGQLLLKVDDADLQAELMRAQFEQKLLSEKLERQRILLERESVSREAFDQVQTDYNMLQADIELLEVRISRTEIRAPFDGVMGFRYVSEGSYVQASTRIATIVDNSVLKFECNIAEKYALNNLIGKEIQFQAAGSDKTYSAKVYAVNPSSDATTHTVALRARFQNPDYELSAGMFAAGHLIFDGRNEFIAIPTEAVVPEMDGKRLWVLRNGKATLVPVETESRDEKDVEVVSGIAVGDTVLTDGLMQLREGMAVKVTVKR